MRKIFEDVSDGTELTAENSVDGEITISISGGSYPEHQTIIISLVEAMDFHAHLTELISNATAANGE